VLEKYAKCAVGLGRFDHRSENSMVSEIEIVTSRESRNQFRISMALSDDILKALRRVCE
jgi:hypothetical protein